MLAQTQQSKPWFSRVPSWVASAALTVALASVASFIGVQRGQAVMDSRLTAAERSITENKVATDKESDTMIPRREFDAYMKSLKESLDDFKRIAEQNFSEIKQDIRGIRDRQK